MSALPGSGATLNGLSSVDDITSYIEQVYKATASKNGVTWDGTANTVPVVLGGLINPATFYDTVLLEMIRISPDEYTYHRYAESSPIPGKAGEIQFRRWAPLRGHTTPLIEGVPPKSDRGSMEAFSIKAESYGRYMEFTDVVDFKVYDPVITLYTKEYGNVILETFDLLAREALSMCPNKFFATANGFSYDQKPSGQYYAERQTPGLAHTPINAGDVPNLQRPGATSIEDLYLYTDPTTGRGVFSPNYADLIKIGLWFKKQLVKPIGRNYHVIGSPEYTVSMLKDPYIQQYMTLNRTTDPMYSETKLVNLFDMEHYETLICPVSGRFVKDTNKGIRLYGKTSDGTYVYRTITEKTQINLTGDPVFAYQNGGDYDIDRRTMQQASFIPEVDRFDIDSYNAADITLEGTYASALTENATTGIYKIYTFNTTTGVKSEYLDSTPEKIVWRELKVTHVYILGEHVLKRTGLSGQDTAHMYVKAKGSAGVLDPIDQRQSIGFKINSVGYGLNRLEALVDYMCIPEYSNELI